MARSGAVARAGQVDPRPRPVIQADLARVKAVFSDVDGTLTTGGRLTSSAVAALERLADAGLGVVLVTGRPAGYAECWLRSLPVEGVIAENGGLYFAWGRRRELRKIYAERSSQRRGAARRRLSALVQQALKAFPGAALSSDSAFTEVDLAIDYHEHVRLDVPTAEAIVRWMRQRGVRAVRSSVHVNCWVGSFDKLKTTRQFLQREWGMKLQPGDPRFVYAGDSLNDAPMFEAFALSVGVANVLTVLPELEAPPRFVTARPEGQGFVELAQRVLQARSHPP